MKIEKVKIDLYDLMPDNIKESLHRGLEQSKNREVFPHTEVMKMFKKVNKKNPKVK